MARHENEDLTGLDIPENNKVKIIYYLRGGMTVADIDGLKDREICAYERVSEVDETIASYYIRCTGSRVYNPYGDADPRYFSRRTWVWRRVDARTFNMYEKFLLTRRTRYLKDAERGL